MNSTAINNLMNQTNLTQADKDRQLKQSVNQFVNQIFYGTLLREMRDSQEPTILDNGPGAQTFIRQLDTQLIDRMSKTDSNSPLVDSVIKQLAGKATLDRIRGNNAEAGNNANYIAKQYLQTAKTSATALDTVNTKTTGMSSINMLAD